ncbi:MAG TPA: hypothetical protein VHO06_04325, partial [Polyangia bacterium]|nr:hypothetical protein [Polyangia bacterium]
KELEARLGIKVGPAGGSSQPATVTPTGFHAAPAPAAPPPGYHAAPAPAAASNTAAPATASAPSAATTGNTAGTSASAGTSGSAGTSAASGATPADLQSLLALSPDQFMQAVTSGKIPADVANSQSAMMAVQARMNQITQMNQLVTSMLAATHQMQMSIIQNIRC